MTQPATSASDASYTPTAAPAARQAYLATYERERATTLRVLRAFPAEQSEFKPAERSNVARQLAWTFVVESTVALRAVRGEPLFAGGWPQAPATWQEVLDAFESVSNALVEALRTADDAVFATKVQFLSGPKQMADYSMMDFLWFMLHDQIHHRGQLSVYVRCVGGKLPSIYGPTADEPWN